MSMELKRIEPGPLFDLNGKLRYTSVSQLQTGERCLRRWYYDKIERRKEPETPAQQRGTALHDEWKRHFDFGEALGPLAMAGLEHKPEGQLTTETPTFWINAQGMLESRVSVDGTPLVGYIDILQRNRVIDIKTTSNAKYAKTPDQLAGDLQMLGYALHTWEVFAHREPIDLRHWYFLTKGKPKSWVVDARVEPADAIANWAKATPLMQTIREAASLGPGRADEVPCNTQACDDYRGCYHRSVCTAGASHLLDTMFAADEAIINNPSTPKDLDMQFFTPPTADLSPDAQASLAKFRNGATPDAALEAAQVGFLIDLIASANYGTPPLTGALAFALCRHKGIAEQPGIAGTKAMQTLERPVETLEDLKELAKQVGKDAELAHLPTSAPVATAAVPPPAPVERAQMIATIAAAAQPTAAPINFATQGQAVVADMAQQIANTLGVNVEVGVLPPDAPSQDERKRGRPPGAKAKAKAPPIEVVEAGETVVETLPARDPVVEGHAAAPAQTLPRVFRTATATLPPPPAAEAPAPVVKPPPAILPEPVEAARAQAPGLELYIDCLPTSGEQPKPLYAYVAECMGALARLAKVDDVRLVDKSSPLAYGNWRGALQAIVVKQPPPHGRWFIDTRGSEPNEVVAMSLIAKASFVVRGLR